MTTKFNMSQRFQSDLYDLFRPGVEISASIDRRLTSLLEWNTDPTGTVIGLKFNIVSAMIESVNE